MPQAADRNDTTHCQPANAATHRKGPTMHTLPSTTITIRPLAGIGCAGLPALIDRRGEPDRDGRPMQVTQVAVAELIASAAGLAMGEVDEGLPAALVSGYRFADRHRPSADLVRPEAEDLFR